MTDALPDERPQRRREYSGAGSTLGLAALVIAVVGVAIWWFEMRGDSAVTLDDGGAGIVPLPAEMNPTGKAAAAQPGRAAPNFRLATPEGETMELASFQGKWVLLNFWASWCPPCRAETPALQQTYTEHGPEPLTVIGVNQQETAETARRFVSEFDVSYPIVLDRSGEVSEAYRVGTGLPVSFLVDPRGVIVEVYTGALKDDQLQAIVTERLQ